jgi:hypothetical protein
MLPSSAGGDDGLELLEKHPQASQAAVAVEATSAARLRMG